MGVQKMRKKEVRMKNDCDGMGFTPPPPVCRRKPGLQRGYKVF